MKARLNGKSGVVGTISTSQGLQMLHRRDVSNMPIRWVEVRLDALLAAGVPFEKIEEACKHSKWKLLMTARSAKEGGKFKWKKNERNRLIEILLPYVDAIDLELKEIDSFLDLLKKIQKSRHTLILSSHFFNHPFGKKEENIWCKHLNAFEKIKKVHRIKNRLIYKIAARSDTQDELKLLAKFLMRRECDPKSRSLSLAVMGMGKWAQASRMALSILGSELVYGYLDKPAASGQPHVTDLIEFLKKYGLICKN